MRTDRQGGFTLIEIMVALAVFSLAAMALIRLESATIRGAATLDETMLAQMVAQSVAVEAVSEGEPPAPGRIGGAMANGGRSWAWTRVVVPTGDPRIVRVEVSVTGPARNVLARASMVRPASSGA